MAPVLELSDAAHSRCLLVELNEQRLRGQFCDVTIIAEDTKFPAHKNVLAASSPYFKEVLSEEPAGRQPALVLELPDIQAGVFSDILNFIYRSRLSVPSPAAARQIGAAGRRLGISWLENLDPAAQAKEMTEPWSPEAAGDTSASSPRSCGSPVDLTCPSRLATSPVCLQEPARPPSPQREADNETETAKILYALSTAPAEPGAPDWEPERGPADPPAAAGGEPAPSSSSPAAGAFRCGLCSRSFATPAALSLHLKLHRSRRSLSCRHCGKSFIHVKRLQTHEVLCKEAGEEEEEVAAAGGSEAPAPAAPLPPAAPALPKPASSKKGLLFRHRALPRLEYIPEQDHFVKVVDGHVIYFCTVCERSYMTLSSLKRHSNVHSWRRKYPCRYCDKVFALAEYRTKHEVWHTGERRYQCIFCWETFVTYYNLKTHQKAFHGINPGLISSEKTPNGGYKPRHALKLYRLLPMRSQKRPYKTYSPGLLAEGLLLPPPQPLPVALGEGDAAGPGGEAGPGFAPANALEAPEAERFLLPAPRPSRGRPRSAEEARRADGEAPSVIRFGHPAASVIVHSTSVAPAGGGGGQASSVITYNSTPAAPRPAPAEPLKKQVLKEYIQAQKAAEQAAEEEAGGGEAPKPRSLRPGRTMTYMAKPAYVGAASESRSAPLCQITVRIGEEAIVKRRISETDLMLDKSPRGPKRFDFAPAEKAAPSKRAGGSYAHNESGEEESDRDAEDQLWRPYYTYKPKRKACGAGSGVPKVKRSSRWRRKLRSLRWMKRGGEEEEEGREEPSPAPARASPSPGSSDAPAPEPAHKAGRGSAEWKHECGACGKLFSALKKLRKHERVHGRPGKDDPAPAPAHRVGRKPSVKFTCAHCAKVCKTAAALSRHMKRHEGEGREPGPPALTTVIAYSKKPEEPEPAPAAVKEEITQEMQVSSSSEPAAAEASRGHAAGQPATPESQGAAPPREEEVTPPETGGPQEAAAPLAEATTSRAELAPVPPAPRAALSLQDPVISHTSPAPPEEEAAGGYPERYPVQEYPLPLLAPGGCRTRKEAEDKPPFLAYPSPLPFGAVAKAGAGDGDGKVSFYPDPYPLMYGHQLLAAYPYNFTNLAALPVALNVVLPDDKTQPLPFLPSVFGYSVNPCRNEAQDGAALGPTGAGSGAGGGAALPRGMLRGEPPAPECLKKGNFL
ncbi:LOW QUALITY PROTEIN: zinc finger and BTB domain-containing protein 4 [Pangshura tecta]